jgi:4-hydroxy-tetrahydrodipicolinate synthase
MTLSCYPGRSQEKRNEPIVRGRRVALVTPFTPAGDARRAALRRLVSAQVDGSIDVLVPCGTTGESVTSTADEQKRVVGDHARGGGRVPVLAGAGSNDTRSAIEKSRARSPPWAPGRILSRRPVLQQAHADGYVRHFMPVADAVTVPIVLYNVPRPHRQQHRREDAAEARRAPNIAA